MIDSKVNTTDSNRQNGFVTHNIKRISVSNVNTFREAPDVWVARYLGKVRFPSGFAAVQGKAVERGVDLGLYEGEDIDACVKKAVRYLKDDSLVLPNRAEELEKRVPIVERMTATALEHLMPLGRPDDPPKNQKQHNVGINVRFRPGDDGTVGLLGYLDYFYSAKNPPDPDLVVDLKTTSKAPTKWSLSHGIQAAVYQAAVKSMTGKKPTVKFGYALTRQRDPWVWLELSDDDAAKYLKIFKKSVIQMEAFLSLSDDSNRLIAATPHNPDTFYWNNAEEISKKFFG
jgi:hypothetical protein